VAQNFSIPNTPVKPGDWWLTGNQHDVDLGISTGMRREQAFAPGTSSKFQNSLEIRISGRNDAPNSANYDSALVTGPGLPTSGLWYFREVNSGLLVVATQRSAPPVTSFTHVCSSCDSFWMSRTQSVSGAAATTYRTNPALGNFAAGSGDGSYDGTSGTRPKKGDVYTFALYKAGVLYKTETRVLLTNLVDATQAVNMQWNDIGANTLSALDPANASLNGALSSLPLSWTQNPAAEQINNLWVSMANGGYDNTTAFAIGATSVVATPVTGTTFTALTGTFSDGAGGVYNGYREVGFNYRMLNGSTKHAVSAYWP
jgi:hypothetical protein